MTYNFNVTLTRPDGPGVIKVDTQARYGCWEFRDGSDGGGLWFDEVPGLYRGQEPVLELIDMDGHTHLPATQVALLRQAGFVLDEAWDWD